MQVERFSFRELSDGAVVTAIRGGKSFKPSGKVKEEAHLPPTFNEEQLKMAEREAHQKGFLEGEQEGRKQAESEQAMIDRKLSETLEKFATSLQPLFENYSKMAVALQQQSPKMALAISRKVAGHALAQNAQAVIDELATRACQTMMEEPKLTITVHDSLADALTKKLEQLATRLQSATNIIVQRDANIPATDCRIEWSQGVMERQTTQIWQQVEKMIEDMSLVAASDAQKQLETLNPAKNAGSEVSAKPDPAPSAPDAQDSKTKE